MPPAPSPPPTPRPVSPPPAAKCKLAAASRSQLVASSVRVAASASSDPVIARKDCSASLRSPSAIAAQLNSREGGGELWLQLLSETAREINVVQSLRPT